MGERTEPDGVCAYDVGSVIYFSFRTIAMHSCPDCGSTFTRRIARTPLMRLLSIGQYILCSNCGERSLILFPNLVKQREEKPIVRQAKQGRKVY